MLVKIAEMKSYKELNVWQQSYQLCLIIYSITNTFPSSETYGLISQRRRAAVSVCANIAEGFNRQSKKEYLQFLYIARGSLQELDFLLLLAKDLKYTLEKDYLKAENRIDSVGRLLSGLINSIKRK